MTNVVPFHNLHFQYYNDSTSLKITGLNYPLTSNNDSKELPDPELPSKSYALILGLPALPIEVTAKRYTARRTQVPFPNVSTLEELVLPDLNSLALFHVKTARSTAEKLLSQTF